MTYAMHYTDVSSISIGEILVNLETIEKHTKTQVNICYVESHRYKRLDPLRFWHAKKILKQLDLG